jgi:hypothetical protein
LLTSLPNHNKAECSCGSGTSSWESLITLPSEPPPVKDRSVLKIRPLSGQRTRSNRVFVRPTNHSRESVSDDKTVARVTGHLTGHCVPRNAKPIRPCAFECAYIYDKYETSLETPSETEKRIFRIRRSVRAGRINVKINVKIERDAFGCLSSIKIRL